MVNKMLNLSFLLQSPAQYLNLVCLQRGFCPLFAFAFLGLTLHVVSPCNPFRLAFTMKLSQLGGYAYCINDVVQLTVFPGLQPLKEQCENVAFDATQVRIGNDTCRHSVSLCGCYLHFDVGVLVQP